MDRRTFDGVRWTIAFGRYEGLEGYAVDELNKVVQRHLPYILTAGAATAEPPETAGYHVLLTGTPSSNPRIAALARDGTITIGDRPGSFAIRVCPSPLNPRRKMAVLAGIDPAGVLYAVRDFEHFYADPSLYRGEYYYAPYRCFVDEMPDWSHAGTPAISNRGLWTWGHVIYDYRRYFNTMSRWKMSIATIWNDFAPVNGRAVVDHAHSRGIKVVWGYSWSWGEEVDPASTTDREKWTQRAIHQYEEQFAGLGGDGIYFQAFTEHKGARIGSASTAALAVDWVNHIARKLLNRHPSLWIQFGLHAEGVKDEMDAFAGIDPRICITWEDAGSFPYHYNPALVEKSREAAEFTEKACALRGSDEDFGLVVKGLSILDWPRFEHQKGPFILGETDARFMRTRAREKEVLWRYVQAQWIRNLDSLLATLRAVKHGGVKRATVTGLVEDGLWEERSWLPAALLGEAMWEPDQDPTELVRRVSLAQDVSFA